MITFERLVELVNADNQVQATIDTPELEHVLRVAVAKLGLVIGRTGEVYDPKPPEVVTFDNSNGRQVRRPKRFR